MSAAHRHAVLVVDDYEPLRYAFATLIELQGCEVETAETGNGTLELLATGYRPCLIVLDVLLPDMDGWELRDQLRTDGRFGEPPVVMVSASPEALAAAPDPVPTMPMPFTAEDFREALATHGRCASTA